LVLGTIDGAECVLHLLHSGETGRAGLKQSLPSRWT
jgi:hypothetical protein